MIQWLPSSADSTIRLWEDERTDAVGTPVSEMKAGPIMSHSVMPTNENDITSIDWSVRVWLVFFTTIILI